MFASLFCSGKSHMNLGSILTVSENERHVYTRCLDGSGGQILKKTLNYGIIILIILHTMNFVGAEIISYRNIFCFLIILGSFAQLCFE